MPLFATTLILAFAALVVGALNQSWPDWFWSVRPPSAEAIFAKKVQPFVQQTCFECHDSRSRKGDFAIDRLADATSLRNDREAWERVLQHVSSNLMPPVAEPQPTPEARSEFVLWLDRALHPIDPKNPDPGHVVVRRLNRTEYKNTVQDLFGVKFNPAEDFPDDDSGHGFDHLGEVLTLSPLLMERYLAAAEKVSHSVVPNPIPTPKLFASQTGDWEGSQMDGLASRASEGELVWNFKAPADGRYRMNIKAYQDQGGPEAARFSVMLGVERITELQADQGRGRPREHQLEVDLKQGNNPIRIAFVNDFYTPASEGKPAEDRNFYLESVSLEGPYPRPGENALEKGLPAWIGEPREGETEAVWMARVLTPVMRRAYRRPVLETEVERVVGLLTASRAAGDSLTEAFQVGIQAILVSPSFLFLGEPPDLNGERISRLSDHALATRLAYFLWNGPPDEQLLDLADRKILTTELNRQTRRMLADPRATRFVENFAGQWLEVKNLPLRTPDRKLFPEWSPELARSMKEETLRFFGDFLTNNLPMQELLTADFTFLDERLAKHYGIPKPEEPGFSRVKRPGNSGAGIFHQAGILTVSSYPNRTSPVLRGKFILEKVLGTPPPPPPPNIPSLSEAHNKSKPTTLRARLEAHRSQSSCMSCHALIDPLGFALEHYDSMGRRRETENGVPVDSAGKLTTGEEVNSAEQLAQVLATARRDQFYRNFASTLLTYALGRGPDYYDRPTIDRIVTEAAARGNTLPAFIDAVVSSLAFQYQRNESPIESSGRVALGDS